MEEIESLLLYGWGAICLYRTAIGSNRGTYFPVEKNKQTAQHH